MPEKLSEEKTKEYLAEYDMAPVPLCVTETIDSTNRAAKELAAAGAPAGALVVSARQTGGRGRLGRSFSSPPGGLYMSLILPPLPPPDPERLFLVTPAAAVAVCRGIEAVSEAECRIKWVNDIYINEKKVSGILAETAVSEGSDISLILGVGINVLTDAGDFPEELRSRAGAIFPGGRGCSEPFVRERLCALVAAELFSASRSLYGAEPSFDFISEYRRRSFLIGRRVTVLEPGGEYTAEVIGIDEKCRLGVICRGGEKDGTVKYLFSGDVSLRL